MNENCSLIIARKVLKEQDQSFHLLVTSCLCNIQMENGLICLDLKQQAPEFSSARAVWPALHSQERQELSLTLPGTKCSVWYAVASPLCDFWSWWHLGQGFEFSQVLLSHLELLYTRPQTGSVRKCHLCDNYVCFHHCENHL